MPVPGLAVVAVNGQLTGTPARALVSHYCAGDRTASAGAGSAAQSAVSDVLPAALRHGPSNHPPVLRWCSDVRPLTSTDGQFQHCSRIAACPLRRPARCTARTSGTNSRPVWTAGTEEYVLKGSFVLASLGGDGRKLPPDRRRHLESQPDPAYERTTIPCRPERDTRHYGGSDRSHADVRLPHPKHTT
jgi:hypothetical protein